MKLTKADVINKSLFFIGAGFTNGTGCMPSADMFKDLREKIYDELNSTFSKTQKEALKFLISCLQYHAEWRTIEFTKGFTFTPNIEELALLIRRIKNRENFLPYPITGNWADKLVILEAQYSSEYKEKIEDPDDTLFESMEKILKRLLKNEWLKINTDLTYLDPLREFIQSNPTDDYRVEIFSLNNDMVIEEYFSSHREVPWRGFVKGRWQGIRNDVHNDPCGRIDLYKLHGSIDWVRLEDMDIWEETKLDEAKRENIQEKHNPYIIFGQGTKTFSVEPFFSLINHFNSQLNSDSKHYFFVIGYSFFDPYINNLLFNAVKGFKKLIIVNPYFGPEGLFIKNANRPQCDPKNFFQIIYPTGTNKSNLTDHLRDIQRNSFYSELPEFNYLPISAENIEYIPLTTKEFIREFFGNNGDLLFEYIKLFEEEKEGRQSPF